MKKTKFLPAFFVLCAILGLMRPLNVRADGEPELSSYSAIVLDRATGEEFFAKEADKKIYPADTVKIMTVLLAVEAIETGQTSMQTEVMISDDVGFDLGDTGLKMLNAGEIVTLGDLLYFAMLPSADDACNAIAQSVSSSIPAFVDLMNERAEQLGCTGTHFTNTHGIYDEYNYSTARDMGRIALEAAQHDMFMRVCSTVSIDIPSNNISGVRTLTNTNPLLSNESVYGSAYLYESASGIKTGYNSFAGYCMVSAAGDTDSGIDMITAVFGGVQDSSGYSSFSDTIRLFNWVFRSFSYQEVLDPTVNIASVDVNLGKDVDYVNLRPAVAVTLLLPNGYDPTEFDLDLQVYSLQQGEIVTAPVTAGEVLGEVSVLRNGQNCGTVKLVAASSVDLSRSQYIRSHLSETVHTSAFRIVVIGLLLLLVLYAAWVIFYWVRRRRYKKAQKIKGAAAPRTDVSRGREAEAEPQPQLQPQPQSQSQSQSQPQPTPKQQPQPKPQPTPQSKPQPKPQPQLQSQPARSTASARAFSSPIPPGIEYVPPEEPASSRSDNLPPWETLPDEIAGAELSLFEDQDERDYFEDFFRKR